VRLSPAHLWLGGLAFALCATLNAGGYRYGASDQAFYIPAILHQLDPALYPRDWAMLGAQGRFFFVDELGAALVRVSGLALPVWFALAQVATLAALYAGAMAMGRAVFTTPWALAAWIAALTLRHRIAKTGANTLEGYFHPRMLVFGLGLLAIADVLHGRRVRPIVILLAGAALHPTTAALFLVIVGVAIAASDARLRRPALITAGAAALVGAAAVAAGVVPIDLTPMDPTWRALVATKDYTFPTTWSVSSWLTNLAGPLVLVAAAWARHRDGRLTAPEAGVVAGSLVLIAGFVASLPFISAGVPIAVQLQTSRAFWPVEILATLFLVWWLVDRPFSTSTGRTAARATAALLLGVSLVRGVYVGFVESPDRPTLAVDLGESDWDHALRWIRASTPADAFVLADPGHAWKPGMGTAVRIGAARDVFLEETKDVAMAMYSREAAHRVAARIEATQGLDTMPEAALLALAAREGLTVFVTPRTLDLPLLHRAGTVAVYRLTP
jgi:hypothetical protein